MSVFGTGTYGSGLYGATVEPGPLNQQRKLYGGWAPFLPGNTVYQRARCWHIGIVDADATWVATIDALASGSSRTLALDGGLPSSDTLDLQILDATGRFLAGGRDAGQLAPNALIGLRKTVTAGALTATTYEQTYRITQAPSTGRDRWGRQLTTTQAEDWLRAPLQRPLGASVGLFTGQDYAPSNYVAGTPLRVAWAIAGTPGTWLDVLLGLYSTLAGGTVGPPTRAYAVAGTRGGSGVPYAAGEDVAATFQDWMGTGPWPSYRQVLDSLQQTFGWRADYDDAGQIRVQNADRRVASGHVVSCDAHVGGAFPVPWETVQRQVQRAQYTAVELWQAWLGAGASLGTPLPGEHAPAPSTTPSLVQAARAVSAHPLQPNAPPLGRTETVTTNVAATGTVGGSVYETMQAVAERRLQGYLAAADQLTLAVDSACPCPRGYEEVRVFIPEDALDGSYAFQGATIPLGTAAASWQLGWRGAR